jgi:hypothetical protein
MEKERSRPVLPLRPTNPHLHHADQMTKYKTVGTEESGCPNEESRPVVAEESTS